MDLQRITSPSHPFFEVAWRVYEQSFPKNERRTQEDHVRALCDPAFHACAAVENGQLLVIAFFWQTAEFTYLEHLAVSPAMRGTGCGTRVLQALLDETSAPLILEIEPPEDDVCRRRKHFYERLGLVMGDFPHWQFPYQPGTEGSPLCIMARPAISRTQYDAFYRFLLEHVLIYTAYRPEGL